MFNSTENEYNLLYTKKCTASTLESLMTDA